MDFFRVSTSGKFRFFGVWVPSRVKGLVFECFFMVFRVLTETNLSFVYEEDVAEAAGLRVAE